MACTQSLEISHQSQPHPVSRNVLHGRCADYDIIPLRFHLLGGRAYLPVLDTPACGQFAVPVGIRQIGLNELAVYSTETRSGIPGEPEQVSTSIHTCVGCLDSRLFEQPRKTAVAAADIKHGQPFLPGGPEIR